MVRRKLLSVLAAVTVAGVLGACSSSSKHAATSPTSSSAGSSGPASTGSAGSASTGTASGTPIKVGFICTCSGLGGFGGFNMLAEDVYKAWADSVNAAGGINGHPVQVITKDDATNPGTALTAAQALIADHVVAIADMSELDATFASAVQAANVPVVGVFTVSAPFATNPDFYPEGQTTNTLFQGVVTSAKTGGAKSIANFYCAEAVTCAQGTPQIVAAGKQLGVPVVYNSSVSFTAPNYTAPCLAAKDAHANGLYIADAASVMLRIASDCTRQNYTPNYVIDGEVFGLNLASDPGTGKNLWADFPDLPFFANTPAVQAFNTAMDKYFPGERENTSRMTQDPFMAWVSGQLLVEAIKGGGLTATDTPSAAEVKAGLESLKGDTVGGLTPPLTFAAGQPHHVNCWFTAHVQNGTPSVANNGQVTCLK
jgi:branched-chain amino acid transport system substrate-binding protein